MTTPKSPRKKPEPVQISVTLQAGPLTLSAEVPALKASATIDAMVNVHKGAVKRHPLLIPELSPVTSGMVIDVEDPDEFEDRKRVGFRA